VIPEKWLNMTGIRSLSRHHSVIQLTQKQLVSIYR
jgi:hypothetical protein